MNSRTLLNIGLLVFLVGLGLLVFYEPGLEAPPTPTTLSAINQDDLTQLRIDREQREPLQFERRQDQWYLIQEQAIPASEFQVLSLLELCGTETKRSYSLDELDLNKLGLDTPAARVSFDDLLTVEFGTTEPLGGYRYVRVGDRVHLIKDRYQHLVEADFTSFINHRLLPEGAQITSLELPQITLARSDDAHWSLMPEDPDVSADAIQELVNAWQHASALWVRKYETGSADAQARILLQGEQEPIVFKILSREPELVLARPDWGIQYHLTGESAANMFNFTKPHADDDSTSGSEPEPDEGGQI